MDESGVHEGSQVITVGAYVGRPTAWSDWARSWNFHKRPIKVFHSTDSAALRGEFKGWTKEQRDELVAKILPTIARASITPYVVGVRLDDYHGLIDEYPEIKDLVGEKPHTACFQWVLQAIANQIRSRRKDQKLAVFHEKNDYEGAASECYDWMQTRYPNTFVGLSFGKKEDFAPLRAADVLAYEANKRLRNYGRPDRRAWSVLIPEAKQFPETLQYFDRESLKSWAEKFRSTAT